MTEDSIDREIQAALAVEPSPEFLARVRSEIAAEPQAATSWRSWRLAAAVAMAAIVAAAIVSRPQEKTVGTAAGRTDIYLPPDVSIVRPPAIRSTPSRAHARIQNAAALRTEPEILVDPRERRAVRLLVRGSRDGGLDWSAALRATAPSVMELPPLTDLVIAPLFIDPLTPSGEEGVRQ